MTKAPIDWKRLEAIATERRRIRAMILVCARAARDEKIHLLPCADTNAILRYPISAATFWLERWRGRRRDLLGQDRMANAA